MNQLPKVSGGAQFPRVTGVVTSQGRDISALCNQTADKYDADAGRYPFPPRLLVAQAIAESNLDEHAKRLGKWPDVSFGLWQQTVAYAPIGDRSQSTENVDYVRHVLETDIPQACEIAAKQLSAKYRQTGDAEESMSRYNAPGLTLAMNPNGKHIQESWARSAIYEEAEDGPVAEHAFQAGFATLADTLGADVVGEPLTDEYQLGPETRQNTTKGVMVWVDGGPALFFAAV